jgi:hypothetical protein
VARKYVDLIALVDAFVAASGEPTKRVLHILGEYDDAGRLPVDLLLSTSGGRFIPPGALGQLVRSLGSGHAFVREHADAALGDLLVDIAKFVGFCDLHGVEPPPLLGRRRRWLDSQRAPMFPALPPPPRPAPSDNPGDVDEVETCISWMEDVLRQQEAGEFPESGYLSLAGRFRHWHQKAQSALSTLLAGPVRRGLKQRIDELQGMFDAAHSTASHGAAAPESSGGAGGPVTLRTEPAGDQLARPLLRLSSKSRQVTFAGHACRLPPSLALALAELMEHAGEYRTFRDIAQRSNPATARTAKSKRICKMISLLRSALREAVGDDDAAWARIATAVGRDPEDGGPTEMLQALIASARGRRDEPDRDRLADPAYRLALDPADVVVE